MQNTDELCRDLGVRTLFEETVKSEAYPRILAERLQCISSGNTLAECAPRRRCVLPNTIINLLRNAS